MIFYSTIKRPEKTLEFNSGEIKVTQIGYRSNKDRIDAMINAGQRLVLANTPQELYDFVNYNYLDELDNVPLDPTRMGTFDYADATALLHRAEQDINDLKERVRKDKEAADKAAKEAAEAAKQVPTA